MIISETELDFAKEISSVNSQPNIASVLKKVLKHNTEGSREKMDFTKIFWVVSQLSQSGSHLKSRFSSSKSLFVIKFQEAVA